MTKMPLVIERLLLNWPATISIERCDSLGNRGGLSGAQLWKITNDVGSYCLRRWPPGAPDRDHLLWIHERLKVAFQQGCELIPVPFESFGGSTVVEYEDHLWELTPWMRGVADFCERPSEVRLSQALLGVAQMHLSLRSTADFTGVPAGITRRLRALQPDQLSAQHVRRWRTIAQSFPLEPYRPSITELLELIPVWLEPVRQEMATAGAAVVPLQACVRDLWHAHLLFEADQLTGIVDFGSMQVDSVCADLTRLLGTMVESDERLWHIGLEAYQTVHPLNANEWMLLTAFDRSSLLLSAVQWIRWLCDEGRHFEDPSLAVERMRSLIERLRRPPLVLGR